MYIMYLTGLAARTRLDKKIKVSYLQRTRETVRQTDSGMTVGAHAHKKRTEKNERTCMSIARYLVLIA